MSISTYAELQAGIKRWLHRGDLDAYIPDFVTLGEARITRMLRLPLQQTSATITPSTTERYVALPSRYLELLSFTNDLGEPVREVTAEQLEGAAAGATPGRPAYCRFGARIDFERLADATYAYTMHYRQRLDLAADGSNSVLLQHPDIYLYSSLMAAAPYIKNDERIVTWAELLKAAVTEANMTVRDHTIRRTEIATEAVFDINTG